MERDNKNTENRKRTRDDEECGTEECHVSKKQENNIDSSGQISSSHSMGKRGCDRFCDPIFDFPWLKDGSVFGASEVFEQEGDMFVCDYSYTDIVEDTLVNTCDDRCCYPAKAFEDDDLRSFEVDDFEPVDCVWSSVIDQPIDT
ncbi:hypothetical protein CASFOL_040581 [Castilleja foliolosa]|uniref:Uncharacterized protein n=1 Tax=Castilleja foliolosa TaxID=1961234 RepID=A0ABD3BDK4_9LAMI